MAKQLNINMAFTADTSQAKKQIADLQTQLSNLMTSSATNTTDSFTNGIQDSIQSVAKLKMALSEATNTKTGIVDLSKFNQNLSDAGLSVEQLSADMAALGPEGVRAFSNVASSIATMESPLKRTNQLLDSFWTALKNSARWQISSGVLHGLTSAVQGAYSYAQDLNKSLSNIAIVTGQNVSEMDAFAEKANKAAQALSVTTTAYTDASLIYYQQGLDDDEVDERTQTTLKMSNVTGESVDEVSSYMTAIWNNFADGSDNLELFADKITALGAATASSSEEIAEGIEQFASLGSTMGLSYDNATAALATVVAQTRQSASTVGNSMRTILQRFQSLSLGETLEDGVDLTDYTSALKTVGVEVLDANGELKDLDEIITDLGSAWQNLGDAERSALAGTVAGVRNSNTLIAWMDNFDKFQENLEVAANAEGSLDEQAEIYAQSWEGAQKRVKAAWQAIYSDIIDDDFFITLNNDLEGILKTVDRVIDGFGGLPALLTTIGTVFTSVFKNQISSGLSDMAYSISMMTPSGQKKQQEKDDQIRNEWADTNKNLLTDASDFGGTNRADAITKNLENEQKVAKAYNKNLDLMTDKQKELNKISIELYKTEGKKVEQLAEEVDKEQEKLDLIKKEMSWNAKTGDKQVDSKKLKSAQERIDEAFKGYKDTLEGNSTKDEADRIEANGKAWEEYEQAAIEAAIEAADGNAKVQNNLIAYGKGLDSVREKTDAYNSAQQKASEDGKALADKFDALDNSALNYGQAILAATSIIGGVVMSINAVKSVWETVTNPDLSGWEKLTTVITSLSVAAGTLATVWNQENIALIKNTASSIANALAKDAEVKALRKLNTQKILDQTYEELQNALYEEKITYEEMYTARTYAEAEAKKIETEKTAELTLAELALKKAKEGLTTAFTEFLVPIAAVAAAIGALYLAFEGLKTLWENYTPSGKVAKASKELEEAQKATEEAKTAYEDLTTAINNYKSAKEEIADMDDGTEKTLKVLEANKAILDQLEESDLLGTLGTLEYDEDGLIQITEAQQQLLKNEQMKEYYSALRLENEKKIASLNANGDKEASEYKGPKIELETTQEQEIDTGTGGTRTQTITSNQDRTTEIVDTMVKAGLTLTSVSENEEKVKEALEEAGYNEKEISSTIQQLKDNVDNTNLADFFSQRAELASETSAYEEQEKASKVGIMKTTFSDYSSQMEDAGVSDSLYALIADMSDSVREAILNGLAEGKTFQEAYESGTGSDYSEAQEVIDQDNKSKIKLSFDSELDEHSLTKVQTDVENFINGLDSEDLKFAVSADFSDISSLEDAQEALEDAKDTALDLDNYLDIDSDYYEENEDKINSLAKTIKHLQETEEEAGEDNDGILNSIADDDAMLKKLSKSIIRFDDAIQDVSDNYDDWMAELESGSDQDLAEACEDLGDAYGNLLDIDGSQLSADFLEDTENLNLMKQATEGNIDAYNQLAENAAKDVILSMHIDDAETEQEFLDFTSRLNSYAQENDIAVGTELSGSDEFVTELNKLIAASGMTADQVQRYLASMGYKATLTEVPAETEEHKDTETYWEPAEYAAGEPIATGGEEDASGSYTPLEKVSDGHWVTEESTSTETKPGATGVKIDTLTYTGGGGVKYQNASHGGGSKGSSGSGSGNKGSGSGSKAGSKKKTKDHKTSSVKKDRYHNIKERLEDTTDALDRLDDASDRAWGKAKLKLMDQVIEKQEKQIQLTKDYITEIKNYAKTDKDALSNTLRELGMSEAEIASQFDENGILKNYEALQNYIDAYYERGLATYNAAVDKYNSIVETYNNGDRTDSTAVDAAEEELEAAEDAFSKIEDKYDDYTEDLEQYEETMNLLQEKENDLIEQWNELYDSKLSKLTDTIELQFELNDDALDQAEWYLDALGDKAEKATDRIATLTKELELNKQKIENNKKAIADIFAFHGIEVDMNNFNADSVSNAVSAMLAKVQAGGMTVDMSTVMDNISDYRDNLMDAYDETEDIVEQIYENIADAFDEWNEKLEKNLDLLDHYDTVIDTYKEIADLLGTDTLGLGNEVAIQYENAKLQNYQAAASAAKDNYDAVQKQLAEAQELLAKATTEAEKEQAQEYLDTVTETLQEAEEEYLSRWQSALEQAEEMYKNSLERNTNAYKSALGGGSANLDMLQEEIDRQKTINELHLEDYEKYKRLGDLSEDINQSLSKNPNIKIQTKLNDLLDDVNEKMAEGVEISDGEATILEKRLALLQAEDQLQTARNSKSAVRLTRDNEGNFSYTYTADTDAIEEAEQNYADKFYDLLDYERDYSEEVQDSLLSSWQDFIDKRNDILEDDMLSESERNEALAKLKDDYDTIVGYYTDQLQFVTDEMGRLKTEDWKDIEETIGRLVATDGDFETSFSDTLLGQMVGADYSTAADALRAWQAAADECYKADSEAYQAWQTNKETINNAVDSSTKTFASDYTSTMQDLATTSQNVAESAKEAAEEMVTSMEGIYESAEKTFTQYNSWLSDLLENINKLTVAINNLKTAQAGDIDATVSSAVTSGQTFLNNTAKDSSWTSDISHFDTGGYTGSWGDSGKLSVLHQKELVLNQDDTSNLLSTISLVKEIVGNFSNNFTDVVSRLNYGVLNNVGTGSLDQNVQIQASFPNVVDHNEIELALNNLVNSASQYVNKK